MAFKDFKVLINHFEGWNVGVLQWNQLKLNDFPELNDTIDLLFHLGFVFGDFTQFFDGFFIIEKSQVPEQV